MPFLSELPLIADHLPKDFVLEDLVTRDTLSLLGGALLASPFIYYGVTAVYNIYFHPLSKYPGPTSWVATPFWYSYLQLRGTCPKDTVKLHAKYGPVVRISANELSFTYPGAWRDIYGHKKSGQPEMQKDERFFSGINQEQTIIDSSKEYHAYLRKLLANGFSDSSLRQQEPLVQEYLNTLMSRLHEKGHEGQTALDMILWYNYFTFDVIGYLTYGESFDCLSLSALNVWVAAFFGFVVYVATSQAAARLPSFVRLPLMALVTPADMKQKHKVQEEILESKVKGRLDNEPPVPDFMGRLIDVYNNKGMSFNQLKQNSRLLIGAGSETTATALGGITYLLLTHLDVYDKLATEIRTTFKSADEITMTSVSYCKYLFAVIEEGLRMYPPSSTQHSRYVPPGGVTLDGNFVPEGMLVGVTTYAMLHSADNWVNPDKFAPERWLPEGERPVEYNADKKDSFQAFSYGPRNCLGKNLAYAEMKLVLSRLLWEFDLENFHPKNDNWLDQPVFLVWQKKPLMVKLHPRQRA